MGSPFKYSMDQVNWVSPWTRGQRNVLTPEKLTVWWSTCFQFNCCYIHTIYVMHVHEMCNFGMVYKTKHFACFQMNINGMLSKKSSSFDDILFCK